MMVGKNWVMMLLPTAPNARAGQHLTWSRVCRQSPGDGDDRGGQREGKEQAVAGASDGSEDWPLQHRCCRQPSCQLKTPNL